MLNKVDKLIRDNILYLMEKNSIKYKSRLGEAMNINIARQNRLLNGKRSFTTEDIYLYSKFFKVSSCELLFTKKDREDYESLRSLRKNL